MEVWCILLTPEAYSIGDYQRKQLVKAALQANRARMYVFSDAKKDFKIPYLVEKYNLLHQYNWHAP